MSKAQIGSRGAREADHSVFHAAVLAIVAGFADTVGFLSFGAFAGLMTGNTVLLGISLAYGEWPHALNYFVIILSFLGGISISVLMKKARFANLILLTIEVVALIAAAFLHPTFASYVLAFAMGLQNATVTRFVGISLNTVFLTGNLQKMVLAAIDHLTKKSVGTSNISTILILWGGYLCGAVLGTQMHLWVSRPLLFAPLLLPLVLIHKRKTS